MTPAEAAHVRQRAEALEAEAARLRALLPVGAESGVAGSQTGIAGYAPQRRALEASERQQRAIFESAVDFAIIATDCDGLVTDWNAGAERILGWTAAEMRGETANRFFTPEDRAVDRLGTEMRMAAEEGRASDERWHLKRDGVRFWASGEIMPLRDEGGAQLGFVKVLQDRTAEHQAAKALREAEAALRRAQEAGGVGVFWVDVRANLLRATPEFCRLYGVPVRDRCAPEEIEHLVLPEYAHLTSNAAARSLGDVARDVEYRIRRPDTGEVRWLSRLGDIERDAAGQPVGFFGVARDITDQRLARDALARSEERYRALFEAIDDGFCIIEFFDGPHGAFSDYVHVEANLGYQRQTGIPDIVGKTLREIAPGEADGWAAIYGAVLRSGQPIRFEREFAAVGRHIEVSAARIEPATRRQVSVLFRDVTARRQAEAALRDQEARLRLATTSARLGTFDYRVQTDALIWDDRCRELFGLPSGVPVSYEECFLAGLHPDDREQAVAAVARSLDPAGLGLFAVEYRTIGLQDGIERWVSANGETLFEDGAPVRLVGTVLDITERKRADAALRASEARVRESAERVQLALQAGAIIGTWNWDLPTDRFTVDEAFARAFGLDPVLGREGLSLQQVIATVHPDDKPGLAAAIEKAISRGGAYFHQYRVRRADGRYYWIEANGRVDLGPDGTPRRFPGVLLDVEERRVLEAERDRAAAALRALNETLELRVEERTRELRDAQDFTRLALTSIGGVGAWTYDAASDQFFCSSAISELYGIDPAQGARGVRRVDFIANVHPDDKAVLLTTMAGGLEREGDLEQEYRICHPNGSVRWVLSRGYTYHEGNRPIRRVGIGVETTRQHELEEQLRQSQKMEAVGQLTGGLAHDFNNLLTGIAGSLELLGARVMQGRFTGLDRYIAAAQGAATRAAGLTHRLLAFSRRQTLDPKSTDANRLMAEMEELLRRTVGPAITVEMVGAAGLWPTLIDPNQLENALLNLCINARDAMPGGGRLTIETANRWLDQRAARERDLAPGQYVSLCVSDTGTGMGPEVVAKAFDPFFTTKPLGQGTGLGLSMIYGFVRQSGGQARIYSEQGEGTMVCLYLPRHLGAAEAVEAAPELTGAPRAEQGETVLVVDDEPTVRMLVTEVLEELGYAAIEAADGASGLRLLQSDARVDLLVTDVGLPGGMNGRQMADAARTVRPNLRVLFITGYAENAVVGNGHLEHGMHVMTKPFAMEALASRIRELIASR